MLALQKKLTNFFYVLLSFPATAMGFALSVQISALSWILSTKYGLEESDIGLVWAAGPIAGIFGQVIFGVISDQVWFWNGRRRPFILIGGVLAALSLLALPWIDVISMELGLDGILGVAIAVALMLDISINIGFNPTRSIIADVTPVGEQRTKGYTWMQTISGTFGMMAYVIGAVWGNYTLIYVGAIIVFLLAFIPPFFIEEPRTLESSDQDQPKQSSGTFWGIMNSIRPLWGFLIYGIYGMTVKILEIKVNGYEMEWFCLGFTVVLVLEALIKKGNPDDQREAGLIGFRKVLAAHAFTWIGIQTMFIYMFSYVKYQLPDYEAVDMGRIVSGAFLILNGVAAILPAFVLEPITRKVGRVRTHFWCISLMALGYAGLWLLNPNEWMIFGLMAILGIGWAATISLPFAIMSQQVDQAKMGLYMGLFNLSVVLPQLVASLGVGSLIESSANKSVIFLVSTVTLAVSALAWYFVPEGEEPNNRITSQGGH